MQWKTKVLSTSETTSMDSTKQGGVCSTRTTTTNPRHAHTTDERKTARSAHHCMWMMTPRETVSDCGLTAPATKYTLDGFATRR